MQVYHAKASAPTSGKRTIIHFPLFTHPRRYFNHACHRPSLALELTTPKSLTRQSALGLRPDEPNTSSNDITPLPLGSSSSSSDTRAATTCADGRHMYKLCTGGASRRHCNASLRNAGDLHFSAVMNRGRPTPISKVKGGWPSPSAMVVMASAAGARDRMCAKSGIR
jgi:hypothetical protein